MKKTILTSIATLLTASCLAFDAPTAMDCTQTTKIPPSPSASWNSENRPSPGFFYVQMNVAHTETHPSSQISSDTLFPGLGLGYRRGETSAIDFAIKGSYKESEEGRGSYWAFPRMSYLRYFTPKKKSSLYAGAGMAWGALREKKEGESISFLGLVPSLCAGYEFNHKVVGTWRSFIELDVSQPAIAVTRKGPFPKPIAELSLGLGY